MALFLGLVLQISSVEGIRAELQYQKQTHGQGWRHFSKKAAMFLFFSNPGQPL